MDSETLQSFHLLDDFELPLQADLLDASAIVLDCARTYGLTLGTAESCTGGLISAMLTSIAGSSDVMLGSVVSYACSVKESLLGVEAETLHTKGAVSRECAEQMACGALRALGCDVALSVTGIAGPGGAVAGKPVGTVWFACEDDERVTSELHHLSGDRGQVRTKTVLIALSLLVDFMKSSGVVS